MKDDCLQVYNGRKETGLTNGQSHLETYTLCQVDRASGNLPYESGSSNQSSVIQTRGLEGGARWEGASRGR